MAARRGSGWQQPDSGGGNVGPLVQRMRAEVEELVEAFGSVPPRLTDLDNRLREIGMAMRDLEVRVADQDATVRDAAAVLKRLNARVEWLERNIRLQAVTDEAQLDDIGPEEIRLAEIAETGQSEQAGLLSGSARSGLESAVQAHASALEAHTRHRGQAIEACRTLAGTFWSDEQHRQAATRFQQERQDAAAAKDSIRQLAGPALRASQQLSDDEDRHRAVADVVALGEQAWTTLNQLLRARLAEAVGSGALLPSWFTGVLGPIPPAQDTRAWMEAGTALLAYRVTYAVSDPIMALGSRPHAGAGSRQLSWYDSLTRQLRDLQT